MTSKQRVHAALDRKPVDRVPIWMWYHPETVNHFAELLEIPAANVDEALGDDIRQEWVNNNRDMAGLDLKVDGARHLDIWGIEWERRDGFNQIVHSPLIDSTAEESQSYKFPLDHIDELLGRMEPLIASSPDYFIGCDVSPCVFEMYWRLRGMENGILDLATEPELANALLSRCGDFSRELAEKAADRYALDWVWTGDDVAGQQSMMMSPRMWRELIKPHLQRVFDVAKQRNLWLAYHCCGTPRPIIGDLIEMGLDVLNPIQGNCPGMDPLELKKEYGDRLAFMGGVDTQGVLSRGSAKEVGLATGRLLEGMTSGGGGYILAASHTVPPETPDENILAMYAEAGVSKTEIFDRAADIRRRLTSSR